MARIKYIMCIIIGLCIADVVSAATPVNKNIGTFDFRDSPLNEVLKVFTMQTGSNVVASPDVKDLKINLYLENVSTDLALETLCKNYGLWYKKDSNVIRVMKIDDFSKGIAFGRDEKIEYIALKYASCVSVAEIIASIYSERISYIAPRDVQSFSHIGTDAFPAIGSDLDISTNVSSTANSSKGDFNKKDWVADVGGIGLTSSDAHRALENVGEIGSFHKDSLIAKGIGSPVAYMTIFLRENALILRSVDDKLLSDVQKLVRQLDTPTRQVLLEMKILEVTLGDGFESMMDLSISPPQKSHLSKIDLVNQGGLDAPTFSMGFLNNTLTAKMELYEKENRLRKVGSPLMLCANNASAKFFQGSEVALRKGYKAETNTNTESAITSTIVTTTLKEEQAGINLQISPSINEDKTVALKINAEISTLLMGGGPEIGYVVGDEIQMGQTDAMYKTTIQDIVVGKDGQTLALGGLIQESHVENRKQVPWISKIPLLGWFFRDESILKEKKEIIFLIRPHIIANPSEGETVSNQYMQTHSYHPFYQDSLETLLGHNDTFDYLTTEGEKRLYPKNTKRGHVIDSIVPNRVHFKKRNELQKDSLSNNDEQSQIEAFLKQWSQAWGAKDMDNYISLYDSSFVGKDMDLEKWKMSRFEMFQGAKFIRIGVKNVKKVHSDEDRIIVRFSQTLTSDIYCSASEKDMMLRKSGQSFRILQEEVLGSTVRRLSCNGDE